MSVLDVLKQMRRCEKGKLIYNAAKHLARMDCMKRSTRSFCALVSVTGLITLTVSACTTSQNSSAPPPPRNPPGHSVPWLSKKANNAADADQYYRDIGAITALAGGGERRETLGDFKARNGFTVNDGAEIEATYYNEADLRFGRNMHCRRRPAAPRIIGCYVVNFGPPPFVNGPNPAWPNEAQSLSDAVAKLHPFATVAMEARNVKEVTAATVLESNGDAPPNLVCGSAFGAPTPCDLHDVDTGLDIFPGDSVAVTAKGSIWSGIWLDPANDANGNTARTTNGNFPLPSATPFSLIGRLGPGFSYFPIGTSRVITNTTAAAQRLFLRTNDDVPDNGNGQFDVTVTYLNRVNFFTYGPNGELVSEAALDIEGFKPTPGICMACHGGRLDKIRRPGSVFVVGATYLPFDVTTFGYSREAGFRLDDQQEALRKLNQLVVESKPNDTNPNRPIVRFINSIYQQPGGVNGAGNVARVAQTPFGWQGHDTTYQWISKPYCQLCHMALEENLDFTTFNSFKNLSGLINADVCTGTRRPMPHAQVPFEKFWKTRIPDAPAGMADIGINGCSP